MADLFCRGFTTTIHPPSSGLPYPTNKNDPPFLYRRHIKYTMASVIRPAPFARQAHSVWYNIKSLSQQASCVRAFETPRTSYSLRHARCLFLAQRQMPSRRPPSDSISAAFHSSAQRHILPPGPRECSHYCIKCMRWLTILQR